jgi:group I intron endonuclease
MSDSIYYIYKITNKINNKIYIGFTSKTLEERFKEHVHKSNKNTENKTYFHKAIKKYGKENFIIEVLDTSNDGDYCLNVLEPYYINLYNSRDNNIGYNIGVGGEGGDNYSNNPNKEIISDKISKKLKHYYEHHEHKLKGRKLSKDHIQKIKDSDVSQRLKIKFNTDEYKNMFRELNLGEKNPMWGKHLSKKQSH